MIRLLVLYLALGCAFIGAFYLDVTGAFNSQTATIGTLDQARGSIRRLAHQAFSWDQVQLGGGLSSLDAVSTGSNGWAQISFAQGGYLELFEGTTVVLKESNKEFKLDFLEGGGRVEIPREMAGKVTVQENGIESKKETKVKVAFASPFERKTRSRPLTNSPYRLVGKSEIRNPVNILDSDGGLLALDANLKSPVLVSPKDKSKLKNSAVLKWKDGGSTNAPTAWEVRLYFSDLNNPLKTFTTRQQTAKLNLEKNGTYYWSVRSLGKNGEKSQPTYYFSFETQGRSPAGGANKDSNFRLKPHKFNR